MVFTKNKIYSGKTKMKMGWGKYIKGQSNQNIQYNQKYANERNAILWLLLFCSVTHKIIVNFIESDLWPRIENLMMAWRWRVSVSQKKWIYRYLCLLRIENNFFIEFLILISIVTEMMMLRGKKNYFCQWLRIFI